MPTIQDIADDLNMFSDLQVGKFNSVANVALYETGYAGISRGDADIAVGVWDDVEALNDVDYNTLQGLMTSGRKISDRPC